MKKFFKKLLLVLVLIIAVAGIGYALFSAVCMLFIGYRAMLRLGYKPLPSMMMLLMEVLFGLCVLGLFICIYKRIRKKDS